MADKNLFEDPYKARRTREKTAEYFKVDDRPPMERLKEWLGIGQKPQPQNPIRPAKYNPGQSSWQGLDQEKER